jgi:DNA modification methylase
VFHHIWSGFKRDSEENIVRVHPTQKPVALTLWALDDYAEPTDVCFDGFAGSGSTLIACEEWGIPCYAAELDPYYCDVIAKRWERITGEKAELVKGEK